MESTTDKTQNYLTTDNPFSIDQSKKSKKRQKAKVKDPTDGVTSTTITVFLCMIFLNIGTFWTYEIPQLFTDQLITYFQITTVEVSLMYSVYSIPGIIFSVCGSLLLTYTGLGIGIFFTASCVFIGMFLVYLGVVLKAYWLVLVGRGVFGIGGEVLMFSQTALAEKWFSGKILSLAIGWSNVMTILGTSANAYLSPLWFVQSRSLELPLFIGTLVTFVSWFASLIYFIIEERHKKNFKKIKKSKNLASLKSSSKSGPEGEIEPKFKLSYVKYFGSLYWITLAFFCCLSISYYQFINFMTDLLVQRYHYTYLDAKNLVGVSPLIICISIPIISPITFKFGKKGNRVFGLCFDGFRSLLLDERPTRDAWAPSLHLRASDQCLLLDLHLCNLDEFYADCAQRGHLRGSRAGHCDPEHLHGGPPLLVWRDQQGEEPRGVQQLYLLD